jgi:hypothetical protein
MVHHHTRKPKLYNELQFKPKDKNAMLLVNQRVMSIGDGGAACGVYGRGATQEVLASWTGRCTETSDDGMITFFLRDRTSDLSGSCEHGDEHPSFIKVWEFIDQLSDYQLLKKKSDPLSYFNCPIMRVFMNTVNQELPIIFR